VARWADGGRLRSQAPAARRPGPAPSAAAGTITAIEPQRRRGGQRFNVHVDGAFAFSLDASLAARLRLNQELDAAALAELAAADEHARALDAAYTFLSYRPRSAREIEQRLQQKGYSPGAIASARERLDRLRLVDDTAFARYWVEQRQAFNPRGRTALRAELRAKGVGAADVAAALPEGDERGAAYQAGLLRLRSLGKLDHPTFRQRMGAYLQRRGFSYGATAAAVERLWVEASADARPTD
jgi:regulatory protein